MFGCVYCYCVYLCGKFHLNKRIMNREIVFRGKRLDNDEWLYGDLMHDNQGGCYIYPLDAENLYTENKVATDTVGQFAGLVDKKGVKIFEGDIVTMMRKPEKRRHYELVRHVVTCNNVCDWVFKSLSNDVLGLVMANHSDFDSYKFEVIGNIYDNPELLSTK